MIRQGAVSVCVVLQRQWKLRSMQWSRWMVALFAVLSSAGQAGDDWPDRGVRIEDMRVLKPLRIAVPKAQVKGKVVGPVVLRAHVDLEGRVKRVALVDSSGSPAHDEAAMHALRAAEFAPKVSEGEPVEVSVVVPMHLPLSKPRADR